MKTDRSEIIVRTTRPEDLAGIQEMSRLIYPTAAPWSAEQLASHIRVFPEGQLVAVEGAMQRVVGSASSLIIRWDDYNFDAPWRDFTAAGFFTNHDPTGRTLYGADVMVHPQRQRRGIGKKLYEARRQVCRRLGLLRIRAGARLRHYHKHADVLSPEEYVIKIVRGELGDPTLSFQLKRGFVVIAVVSNYLRHDPESLGHAAVIEWLNPAVATPEDYRTRPAKYLAIEPSGAG